MATLKVSSFQDIDEAKQRFLGEVDSYAEELRAQIITAAPGQAMAYEAKHREAMAGGGPFITSEALALEVTEQEVIDSVIQARTRWEEYGSLIESNRLRAKAAIRKASTPAEMHQIVKEYRDA